MNDLGEIQGFTLRCPDGVDVRRLAPAAAGILTTEALEFVAKLERKFGDRRAQLLAARDDRQRALEAGKKPDFLESTRDIREADWTVPAAPDDLQDRRVEITGPVDRKMVINALNSGARVFMADFEDSLAPAWDNLIDGQRNLFDAVRRSIAHEDPRTGKRYALMDSPATLIVRPRGWHLNEDNLLVDGRPMSASLFDFGLFFFHNAREQLNRGTGPYFYLPKMESHLEARLWNDVFTEAQDLLGIPHGSIRATVLIETILAAFEMDEILYELRDHIVGLNCGRWDYIFSIIKRFRHDPAWTLPDRSQVTMAAHCMRSYSRLLIQTCHRRGAHAIGGMAAQIPIKNDAAANDDALNKVRGDKEREAGDGHDGTWVAHPGLVPIAMEIFDRHMPEANQLDRSPDIAVTAEDLLTVPEGTITEAGLRQNLNVGIQYLAAWLAGQGCVPLFNLMEDAATAEISRSQVWQWRRHGARFTDSDTVIDDAVIEVALADEIAAIRSDAARAFSDRHLDDAAAIFRDLIFDESFQDFLTQPAYRQLNSY